jgi:hypothetical protein
MKNSWWLWNLEIWNIIIPKNVIKYKNNLQNKNYTHISVPSPIIETNNFLKKIEKLWISTIDVEYTDLYNLIWKNLFWFLIVSDIPWKKDKNKSRISDMNKFNKSLLKIAKKVTDEFILK